MYLVVSGELEVVRRDEGSERRLALLRPGDVLGEIGFIRATRRTADVRALEPVSVLRFDRDKLANDLRFFPGIVARLNFNISCILGRRLADLVESRERRDE
jgi:CRP-like cAMP-binding protein